MLGRMRIHILWGISAIAIMSTIVLISLHGSVDTHIFFGFCSMAIAVIAMLTSYYLNRNSKDVYTFALMTAATATWLTLYVHLISEMGYLGFLNHSSQTGIQIQHMIRLSQSFVILSYLLLRRNEERIWLLRPLMLAFLAICYGLIYFGAFPALIDSSSRPTFIAISFNAVQLLSISVLILIILRRKFLRPYLASFTIGGLLLTLSSALSLLGLRLQDPTYHIGETLSSMFAYLALYIGFTIPSARGNFEMGLMPVISDRSSLITALPHPAFITDRDMVILSANKEAERWLKKSHMELIGRTLQSVLPMADAILKDMVTESNLTLKEAVRPTQNIAGRHVSLTLYPSINRDNKASRFTFVGWDVTGEVQAEAAVTRSEQMYRSLFLNIGTGFMLFKLAGEASSKEIEIIDVNPAFERNTGEKGPFPAGGKLKEITSFMNAGWFDMITRAALDRRSVIIDGYSPGSQRWLSLSTFPITDETFGMVISDQTSIRNFQREISSSELKYRTLVEGMPMFVLSLDSDFRVTYVNDSLRGSSGLGNPEEYLGKALDEVFSSSFCQLISKMSGDVSSKADMHSEELEMPINGKASWQRWMAKSIIDSEKTLGYIFLGQDITEQKVAAQKISLSEERFRTLFMENYLPMLIVDADNLTILMANKASQKFYGLDEEDLQGKPFTIFSPPQDSDSITLMARSTIETGFSSMCSKQISSSGLMKDVDLFASTLLLADKVAISFTVNDISERRQMEDRLEQERTYLDSLFENNPDAVVVIDSGMRITRSNSAFRRLFGFSGEVIIGKRMSELIGSPQTEREIEENINRSLEGNKLDFTARRLKQDGTSIPVRVICIPMTLADGSKNVYAIYHDLSDLAQSQEMLSLANEVVKESPAVLFKWSNQAEWPIEYVSANVSRWGYSTDDLLGRKLRFSELVDKDDLARVTKEVEDYLSRGISEYVQEYRLRKADGQFIWVEDHTRIVKSPEGEIEGIQGVIIDNTEKKLAEIERMRIHEDLKMAWNRSLDVLSSVTEFKDPYTAGHQRGVAEVAASIARRMGLPDSRIEAVSKTALVHDIGKLHIPADILNRPRALTPLEYKLVKMHCQSGRDILSKIELPWPLAEIVYQHHERIDGSGYPRGLKGDEILLEARIIAVSDIVDAMTSHRPYRAACSIPDALKEILSLRGTSLDPDVVDACIEAFKDKGFKPAA